MQTGTVRAAAALMLIAGAALAGQDDVILEVTGDISDGKVALDREALKALPETTLETSTVVTDGTHSFTGFLMRDLLKDLGAEGERVIASALNEYVVEIPMTDFTEFDVIVAYSMDGEPLQRNDKGPLWIVYPRDEHEALQDIRYDYRWVWQLSRLEVQ
ncbi:molybdopterin-dependent oxidoreductase [Aquicoccus sp. SCR17]|nr:molybdopterin-dependent oxidoreductase [Carideicomes alvinocaridis]